MKSEIDFLATIQKSENGQTFEKESATFEWNQSKAFYEKFYQSEQKQSFQNL